jgi:AraC family transcriptional regulator of adaptative response/methylated-DNA-[protein]-cysteine methyltransferase
MDISSYIIPFTQNEEVKGESGEFTLTYGWAMSPFGQLWIAVSHRGICAMDPVFSHQNQEGVSALLSFREYELVAQLKRKFPFVQLKKDENRIKSLSNTLTSFWGNQGKYMLPLHLKGTDFQLKVWQALLEIPFGQTRTYEEIACRLGERKAARAVGNAIAQNPVFYAVPCHRVIRSNGEMGAYRWGKALKQYLLGWEKGLLLSVPDEPATRK